ncbi:MAG: hypothetical protein L0H64_08250 [Pseudonocardia sp.]|nr:hypothetical protein [Pseudonocardia sp.]
MTHILLDEVLDDSALITVRHCSSVDVAAIAPLHGKAQCAMGSEILSVVR